jgi:hypothetical protein
MLFQIKSYLQFLWNSKNEHGIHSPFVFHLVTKCFYEKTEMKPYFFEFQNKTNKEKLLNRIFHYFKFQEGLYFSENKIATASSNAKIDFIFIDAAYFNANKITLSDLVSQSNNNTCFIFDSIYNSSKNFLFWNAIVQDPTFTVTIDTYLFGFAFVRKEQEKEHFVIRV